MKLPSDTIIWTLKTAFQKKKKKNRGTLAGSTKYLKSYQYTQISLIHYVSPILLLFGLSHKMNAIKF